MRICLSEDGDVDDDDDGGDVDDNVDDVDDDDDYDDDDGDDDYDDGDYDDDYDDDYAKDHLQKQPVPKPQCLQEHPSPPLEAPGKSVVSTVREGVNNVFGRFSPSRN